MKISGINLKPERIYLSPSKSESNRLLIINALSEGKATIENLSDAGDTIIMNNLLNSEDAELYVKDAGTTMRFLTAYFSVKGNYKILTGTTRMNQRPIKILVDALKEIGADIIYKQNEGYPPVAIKAFKKQLSDKVKVRGDISSQYISALLMIAPVLPKGLTIELSGKVTSWPYIKMTLGLMSHFGINYKIGNQEIEVPNQLYRANHYSVESDWSGASYWYSLLALAKDGRLKLSGLKQHSFQGDQVIVDIMKQLGVASEFDNDGVLIKKTSHQKEFQYNFSDCPDLVQTVAVVCAVKGIKGKLSGLKSLRIKETDRILALQRELAKIGAGLDEISDDTWLIKPVKNPDQLPGDIRISTYEDHRMAMAFAPLGILTKLIIDDPFVVNKSYPRFWNEFEKAGAVLEWL